MDENSTPGTADEETSDSDASEGEAEQVDFSADQNADGDQTESPPEETVETSSESTPAAEVDEVTEETAGSDAAESDADETADDATEADAVENASDGTADQGAEEGENDTLADDVPEPDIPEDVSESAEADSEAHQAVPEDVRKYARFKKMDGAEYDRVNEFLRDRTYITAREWAIARLCADFRTETGVEMTKIGQNLPRLIPFMTDTYTPQAVNQARASFEEKVNKAGSTFLYGAMSGFFTAEELDEMMYEVTEVAKFLLEVEGVDLSVEEELTAEDKISEVMREVRQSSAEVRGEEVQCPECGHVHDPN